MAKAFRSKKVRVLTTDQVEESIKFADGALAAAGHVVRGRKVRDDARRALRGEISFDDAVKRAAARARQAEQDRAAS